MAATTDLTTPQVNPAKPIGRGHPAPQPRTAPPGELHHEIADLATLGDVRALVEAELADLIPQECVDATGLLVDELTARAADAGLLPVRLTVRRDDAGVEIEVRWKSGPGYLSAVFEQWSPDQVTDWAAQLIKESAEVCGVTLDADRAGMLWARLSTL